MDHRERGQVAAPAAEVYDEFFVPALFGQCVEPTLRAADVRPGHVVLDVGCGTGIVARAAREVVGDSGRAVGVDPNAGMLAVARRHDPDIEWCEGAAEALPFDDDEFDRTLCQFAAMFFEDRDTAVAELGRVTRPGGLVTITTWADASESPGYAAMIGLLGRVIGPWAADALRAPFVIGSAEQLDELVAPLDPDAAVTRFEGTARFASIDAWLHTDIRGWTLADGIDDDQYAELLEVARRDLAGHVTGDGTVAFPAPALIATATVA